MAKNAATHPDWIASIGSLLEDFGIVKIALPEESHVPFEKAMNGAYLGFPLPDWLFWAVIAYTAVVTAMRFGTG